MPKAKHQSLDGDANVARFLAEKIKDESGEYPIFSGGQLYKFDGRLWRILDEWQIRLFAQGLHGTRGLKMSAHMTDTAIKVLKMISYTPGVFQTAPKGVVVGKSFVRAGGQPADGSLTDSESDPEKHARGRSRSRQPKSAVLAPVGRQAYVLEPVAATHRAVYGYDFEWTDSKPKEFLKFLKEVWLGDDDREEKAGLLAAFLGACILGTVTEYERAVICFGKTGDNGKSILMDVIAALFHENHRTAIPPQMWSQEYYRQKLAGSRINLLGELDHSDIKDVDSLKAIISGNLISGRQIREDITQFKPIAGQIWNGNRLPVVLNPDDAFWKRFFILEFNRRFDVTKSPPRHEILAPLLAEIDKIACWAIRAGCELYCRGHYVVPDSSETAKSKWQLMADQVRAFLEDAVPGGLVAAKVKNGHCVGQRELYEKYKKWHFRTGRQGRLNESNFFERLSYLGVESVRGESGSIFHFGVKEENEWGAA